MGISDAILYYFRYFLFHWPTFSAVIGISVNAFFISLVLLIAWCNLGTVFDGSKSDQNTRKQQLREDLIREKGKIETLIIQIFCVVS